MKPIWLWALLFVLLVLNPSSFAAPKRIDSSSLILGKWKFIGYIYEGQFQEPPNPNLVLTFEFFSDGTDTLRWSRLNEEGFCERKGNYSYDGRQLTDEVIWVNPDNSFECYRDPDMSLGKVEVTPLKRDGDQLFMDLPLSDQVLTYVWNKQDLLKQQNPKGY